MRKLENSVIAWRQSSYSLDIVEAIMALEEKFDIEIPDEDAEKMRTVQDAIDYIRRKKGDLN